MWFFAKLGIGKKQLQSVEEVINLLDYQLQNNTRCPFYDPFIFSTQFSDTNLLKILLTFAFDKASNGL